MINSKEFSFGQLQIEQNIVIGIVNEGIHVCPNIYSAILESCNDIFGNRSFGYISYRLNSYSIDPTVYTHASRLDQLNAIAVVTDNPIIKSNVSIERQFYNKPFELFANLEDAKNWISKF